jgi:hypothetical protein
MQILLRRIFAARCSGAFNQDWAFRFRLQMIRQPSSIGAPGNLRAGRLLLLGHAKIAHA